METQPVRNFTRVAVAIVVAAIVISAAALSYSSFESTVTKTVFTGTDTTTGSTITSTATTTSLGSCSMAVSQKPLLNSSAFLTEVQFDGQWNATAVGYTNASPTPALDRCYFGSDTGYILIPNWNLKGESALGVVVQKMSPGAGNLTATLGSDRNSTISAYGSVQVGADFYSSPE